ncbi:Variant surface glycoprotein [Trypanosoma congolense IL3000]|uniref:Variant surface glycoprotein n=1 Tax=Trypanosoma congolense (strain IL3000) TaxID=1068625 RepID=F9WEL1_TRYCI|nr:Variant surface glycoprotein [Trypanosoma congolense IL3000]
MGMWFWMVVCLVMRIGGASTGSPTQRNKKEHDVLCGLLGAAAEKWKTTNNPQAREALAQAIFGNKTGGDIETLKQDLPEEFKNPGNRANRCGSCMYSNGKHYPGWSIPHDMLCMCTVGQGGFPFLEKSNDSGNPTLCGRSAKDFGCEQNRDHGTGCHGNKEWWNETTWNRQAKGHLNATWEKVVKPCLGGEKLQLEAALKNLTESRKDRETPSWAQGHGRCNGISGAVCVYYGYQCHDDPRSPQWWQTLYEALTASEDTRAQGNSTRSSSGRRARRHTGGATTAGEPGDDSTEDESQHSGSASTNNHNHPLPLLSGQQSDTSLTQPLGLLSAALLV